MTHKTLIALVVTVVAALPLAFASVDAVNPVGAPAPETTASRPAVVMSALERESQQIPALDDYDEAVWLGEGDARFLAVKRTSVLPEAAGTMVLVRNRAAGVDADDRIGYLRKALPRVGWNTVTIDLPDPRATVVPARERERLAPVGPGERYGRATDPTQPPTAKPEPATSTVTPLDDTDRDRVLARLRAAVADAARDGTRVIMAGEGEAAAWVARANGTPPLARAAIVLNIDDPQTLLDGEPASHWVQSLTVPSLVMQEAPRTWSPDARLPDDADLLLLPPTRPAGEERLIRLVRGWLKRRDPG
jgi:hypothetical protein